LIGKSYWKGVALPGILYGSSVIDFTKSDIEKLQKIENKVYRQILGAPLYTPQTTLRGEIGATSMEARIMKSTLKYLKYLEERDDTMLSKMSLTMRGMHNKSKWTKNIKLYLSRLKLTFHQLNLMTNKEIEDKIRNYDTDMWKKEMESKSTIHIYRQWRTALGKEEKTYDNKPASVLLFRARTNTLPLKDRNRHTGGKIECDLCGAYKEDLEHFLLDCTEYGLVRQRQILLQKPFIEDKDYIIGLFLFSTDNVEAAKETIQSFWRIRERERRLKGVKK
jgi:hypothetical protein